jgi:hypothetical protein
MRYFSTKLRLQTLSVLFMMVFGIQLFFSSTDPGRFKYNPNRLIIKNDNKESYFSPPSPSSEGDFPIIPTTIPNLSLGLIDNTAEITGLTQHLTTENITDSRPSSILATYWATLLMDDLSPTTLTQISAGIESFLLGQYNPTTQQFEEPIQYEFYNTNFGEGASLLKAPYTPEIIHSMAIILLAKLNRLESNFDQPIRDTWATQLLALQNTDFGFGTLHSPNSTLVETYYITYAVSALNNFAFGTFSPVQRQNIANFIAGKQRTSDWAFGGIGSFGEYDSVDYQFAGWENFMASWYALKTMEITGANTSSLKQPFIDFLTGSNLYNTQKNCFYAEYNQRLQTQIATYYGTAIIGDCLKMLDAESAFPSLTDAKITLLNSTRYNQTSSSTGENYFYRTSQVTSNDLLNQYLAVNYLKKSNLLGNLADENNNLQQLTETCQKFFTAESGASYIPNYEFSPSGEHCRYRFISHDDDSVQSLSSSVLSKIISRIDVSGDHFIDSTNPASNPYGSGNMLQYNWKEDQYNPISNNFHAIGLLEQWGLFDEFIDHVQMDYLDFEAWITTQMLPDGRFSNDTCNFTNGDLKSSYQAIESQRILISHDAGQTFNYYYSSQNISSILAYANQFNVETGSLWYASSSGLSDYESTLFVVKINEALDGSAINYVKLNNYLSQELIQSSSLSELELTALVQLLKALNYSGQDQALLKSAKSHSDFETMLGTCIQSFALCPNNIDQLSAFMELDYMEVYLDLATSQTLDQDYSCKLLISSLISIEEVSNLILDSYSTWGSLGDARTTFVSPIFSTQTPNLWEPVLSFTWHNQLYSKPLTVEINIPWTSNLNPVQNLENESLIPLVLDIQTSLQVQSNISLSMIICDKNLVPIFTITPDKINKSLIYNIITISTSIPNGTLVNGENYSITCDFEQPYLDSITHIFKYSCQQINSSVISPTDPEVVPPVTENNSTDTNNNSTSGTTTEAVVDAATEVNANVTQPMLIMAGVCCPFFGVSVIVYKRKIQTIEEQINSNSE